MSDDTFAARLRAARERAGLSVQQLAEAASLSRQGIYDLEAGRSEPGLETAQRLASALGADLAGPAAPARPLPGPDSVDLALLAVALARQWNYPAGHERLILEALRLGLSWVTDPARRPALERQARKAGLRE